MDMKNVGFTKSEGEGEVTPVLTPKRFLTVFDPACLALIFIIMLSSLPFQKLIHLQLQ